MYATKPKMEPKIIKCSDVNLMSFCMIFEPTPKILYSCDGLMNLNRSWGNLFTPIFETDWIEVNEDNVDNGSVFIYNNGDEKESMKYMRYIFIYVGHMASTLYSNKSQSKFSPIIMNYLEDNRLVIPCDGLQNFRGSFKIKFKCQFDIKQWMASNDEMCDMIDIVISDVELQGIDESLNSDYLMGDIDDLELMVTI